MVMNTVPLHKPDSNPELRTVKAGEFKAKCLAMLDAASLRQQPIAITKHGKVVAHVVAPPEEKPFRSIFGRTPNIKLPTDAQWTKMKSDWADDWDESTRQSLKILREAEGKARKRKKK